MRIPALVVALLLVFSGVAPVAASVGDAESGASGVTAPESGTRAQVDGEFGASPQTVMRVQLQNDGDARWRVEMRYRLDTPNETTAFERIGREYENGSADVSVDADLFRRIAQRASESTGRQMQIRNETYDYSVDEEAGTGTLTVEFSWTNFLRRAENGDLALGDVFVLPSAESEESRTWLSLLSDRQRLVIREPPGYGTNTTSIPVKQENNAIIIDGPSTFEGEDSLVVTYYREGEDIQGTPWDLVVGGGIVAALLIAVAVIAFRWRSGTATGGDGGPGSPRPTPESGDGATNGGVGASPPPEAEEERSEPPDDTDDAAEAEDVDLSLLSDEERVERLLEQNGGRMKQANIVTETGWSDAKVSQLLSAMADEGRVDKLRLGRENLISLPDDDGDEN